MKVIKIACGSAHNAVIVDECKEESKTGSSRKLYTWGSGLDGRLGHGDTENKQVPIKVEILSPLDIQDVSCGFLHTAVVGSGKLFTFGHNGFGQLGSGDAVSKHSPYQIVSKLFTDSGEVKQVTCGGFHTVCLCSDNLIYSWGDNSSGKKQINKFLS